MEGLQIDFRLRVTALHKILKVQEISEFKKQYGKKSEQWLKLNKQKCRCGNRNPAKKFLRKENRKKLGKEEEGPEGNGEKR